MKPAGIALVTTLFGLWAMGGCKSERQPAPITTSAAELPKPMLDGTYSDMKVIPGEGDVIGIEVRLTGSQAIPAVTFQCAQGERSQPRTVSAEITQTTVRFKTTDSTQCPGASYSGLIGAESMSLSQVGPHPPAPEMLKLLRNP